MPHLYIIVLNFIVVFDVGKYPRGRKQTRRHFGVSLYSEQHSILKAV